MGACHGLSGEHVDRDLGLLSRNALEGRWLCKKHRGHHHNHHHDLQVYHQHQSAASSLSKYVGTALMVLLCLYFQLLLLYRSCANEFINEQVRRLSGTTCAFVLLRGHCTS